MPSEFEFNRIFQRTLASAVSIVRSTWLWILAFCVALIALPVLLNDSDGPAGSTGYGIALAVYVTATGWSCAVYRMSIKPTPKGSFWGDFFRLTVANFLFALVMAVVLFIAGLALIIISVVLVAASGYEPTASNADDVNASIDALRASGAIWVLYAMIGACVGGVVWMALRLFIYGAATVARGQILVFQTWPWTKRRLLVIAPLVLALIAIPLGVISYGSASLSTTAALALVRGGYAVVFLLGLSLTVEVYKSIVPDAELAE